MRAFMVAVMFSVPLVAVGAPQLRFRLPGGCALPFASITPASDSFAVCDNSGRMSGAAPSGKAKQLQAAARNNLCASTSDIVSLHFEDFSNLENATDRTQLDLSARRANLITAATIPGTEAREGCFVESPARLLTAHPSDCR